MGEIIEIYLNSKTADYYHNGSISDATYYLPNINLSKRERAFISVKDCVIPYSFYNVNSNNDRLDYELNSVDYSITLENGNYNVLTLKTYLLSLLDSGFSIVYEEKTNKYTFGHTTYDFVFKSSSTCFEILGFKDGFNYTSPSLSLTSNIQINLFTIKNLYITSDNFILNNIDSNNHNKSNIICSVPVKGIPNSIIFYSDNTKHLIHTVNNLTSLKMSITDENGNLIEFNNLNYSITLEITITK